MIENLTLSHHSGSYWVTYTENGMQIRKEFFLASMAVKHFLDLFGKTKERK